MRSKKAVYNIFSSLLLQLVIIISGFIVPKIIITSFGSDVNGLVSSITQFLAYISLLEAGIGPVIKSSLYKPIANKDKNTIQNILKASEKFFRVISSIFILYLVFLCIFYPLIINNDFSYLYTFSLIIIISISTFFEYYFGMSYKLYLQAEQKTYVISIIQILVYILNILMVIVLIKFGANIQIIKLVSGFTFVLRPILQNIYVKKKYNIDFKKTEDDYKLKQKWDGMAQHVAAVVHNNVDITILTIFCKLSEISVYSVYYMIVKGIKSIVSSFAGGIDASFGDMIAKGEKEKLNESFNVYEVFFHSIATIFYTCTIILIVPFVRVYTYDIMDVNYVRPFFGFLIVLSKFVWTIRMPYSSITLAAGHFKETKKGAWIEAIANILVSIVLVINYGIIGVAIGTLVAMIIRTCEFVYHTNKYILERNIFISVKKIAFIIIEVIIILAISSLISLSDINSYISFIVYGIIIFIISSIVIILFDCILYRNELKKLMNIFKSNFVKGMKKNERI